MNIFSYVEAEKSFYETQTIPLIEGDDFSQYQLIRAINFARRSRYIDDNASDDIIGDFPYENISKYRIRLEARSTDFDIKHIEVAPVDSSDEARVAALVASKALHKKLRDIKFGTFLNRYADTRPEYGGVIVKKTRDGVHVVPWENVITDMSDILGGVIIERHFMRPSQIKKQTNWKNVDEAIRSATSDTISKDLKDSSADEAETLARFIEVYEVHGELPVAMLKMARKEDYTEADLTTFVTCSIIYNPTGQDKDGEYTGIIFKAEEIAEADFPYKYDCRHPITGRGLGEGIPEELSEHQRWHNYYKTEQARAMAIGGKVLFVTDDAKVTDSVYDEGIEHGTILKVGENRMFQQLNTIPSSVPVVQTIIQDIDDSADRAVSSFEAVLGEESKSGTPFRAQYLQNVAGNSQFEREREDMGLFITEIIEDWLLEDALKDAARTGYIDDNFTKQDLAMIDKALVEKQVQQAVIEQLRSSESVMPEQLDQMRQSVQIGLAEKGTRRRIEDIKTFIKMAGKKVLIHTTDEQRSKQVLFESFSNALALFADGDPAKLAIRDRILDQMGVTSEELAMHAQEAAAVAASLPQGGRMKTEALKSEEAVAPVIA